MIAASPHPADSVPATPFTARRRAAGALRRLRETAGLVQTRVAADLDWSTSKLLRIEAGTHRVTRTDAEALLRRYDADDGRTRQVIEWVQQAQARGWWDTLSSTLGPDARTMLAWESSAARTVEYQSRHMPELLQTPAYRRALTEAVGPSQTDPQDSPSVIGMRRAILDDGLTRTVTFVLSEAVLLRSPSTTQVLVDQLDELTRRARTARAAVRVLPLAGPVAGPAADSFTYYALPPDETGRPDHVTVWVDPFNGRPMLRGEPDDLRRAETLLEAIDRAALPVADSLEFIARARDHVAARS